MTVAVAGILFGERNGHLTCNLILAVANLMVRLLQHKALLDRNCGRTERLVWRSIGHVHVELLLK